MRARGRSRSSVLLPRKDRSKRQKDATVTRATSHCTENTAASLSLSLQNTTLRVVAEYCCYLSGQPIASELKRNCFDLQYDTIHYTTLQKDTVIKPKARCAYNWCEA
mmetsp:Transcript_60033/g.122472  ORF Transcript_60033/g.122472 Transcript_60033/m.122472 type:complete len:107 (+) Transcript_60033:157-477(+)